MQMRGDEAPVHVSEATRKKAEAAKSYIENMYKLQHQNIQDRLERCNLTLVCECTFASKCLWVGGWLTMHTVDTDKAVQALADLDFQSSASAVLQLRGQCITDSRKRDKGSYWCSQTSTSWNMTSFVHWLASVVSMVQTPGSHYAPSGLSVLSQASWGACARQRGTLRHSTGCTRNPLANTRSTGTV